MGYIDLQNAVNVLETVTKCHICVHDVSGILKKPHLKLARVPMGDKTYDIEWSADHESIQFIKGDMVTVDLDESWPEEIRYIAEIIARWPKPQRRDLMLVYTARIVRTVWRSRAAKPSAGSVPLGFMKW